MISENQMGKTFRREKSYKPRGGRPLNNHRDLPDYDVEVGESGIFEDYGDDYAEELYPKKRNNKPGEDPKTSKND
jgi:hypothetical protein